MPREIPKPELFRVPRRAILRARVVGIAIRDDGLRNRFHQRRRVCVRHTGKYTRSASFVKPPASLGVSGPFGTHWLCTPPAFAQTSSVRLCGRARRREDFCVAYEALL